MTVMDSPNYVLNLTFVFCSLLDHDNHEMRAKFRKFISEPVMVPRYNIKLVRKCCSSLEVVVFPLSVIDLSVKKKYRNVKRVWFEQTTIGSYAQDMSSENPLNNYRGHHCQTYFKNCPCASHIVTESNTCKDVSFLYTLRHPPLLF